MINTKTRLDNLLNDNESRNEYRKAIQVLEEMHIFDLLREVKSEMPINVGVVMEGKDLDLMNYYVLRGYMQALNDIEYLIESKEPKASVDKPDFGARDSLLKDGWTIDEVNKMLSGD